MQYNMNNNKVDLGFGGTKTSNRIKLNEISLDGQDGGFTYKKFLEPKDEAGFYPQEKLTAKSFEGVLLLVRRKLQMFVDADNKTYATNEFNKNTEEITFYGQTGSEKGTAESLRAKYPLLKTLAVVYFYSPKKNEMVRLNCKGLGLQPEDNKGVNYKGLFQYLGSFGENEMPSDYMTTVSMVSKEIAKGRKTKTYYAMRFEQGNAIQDDAVKSKVAELQALALSQFQSDVKKTEEFNANDIEYPEDRTSSETVEGDTINIDDIPF